MYNNYMTNYIDVHNHIVDKLPIKSIYNSYCLKDVENIHLIKSFHKSVGIHPLHISKEIDFEKIEDILSTNNHINVGEVGLDRFGDNREEQYAVLIKFIELGNKYNKSFTFHCVKSWGKMEDIVKKSLNRDLPHMFHGFSGSSETMQELLNGNSFFSFSLRELNRDKIINVIKSIPTGKLLIESDMSNDRYNEIGENNYTSQIKLTYNELAKIKDIPTRELISIINKNFKLFLKE